jgi:hypothetical protein
MFGVEEQMCGGENQTMLGEGAMLSQGRRGQDVYGSQVEDNDE